MPCLDRAPLSLFSVLFLCLCLPGALRAQEVSPDAEEAAPAETAQQEPAAAPPAPAVSFSVPAALPKGAITTRSAITSVIVYGDRARVTREAVVEVPAGKHSVVFTGLPAALVPDTLRVEGASSADVRIGGVAAKKNKTVALTATREKEIRQKIEGLRDQEKYLTAEKAALQEEKKFLAQITGEAGTSAAADLGHLDLKPEQWNGAAQTLHGGLAEMLRQGVQQDLKVRDLDRQIGAAQLELDNLGADRHESYQVEVPLETSAATKLTLDLTYQVPGAAWTPLYDARLDSSGASKLELVQFGQVTQTTGEDWTGVSLTLSTAQPERGASLPELVSQWVDASERGALQRISASSLVMDSSDAFDAGGYTAPPAPPPAPAAQSLPPQRLAVPNVAEIKTGGFVAEYRIPGPSTVPADGTATKLMVGAFQTESRLEIHVKPQQSVDAFLVARAKLKGDAATLPGAVNLFRDGAFVGQAKLPLLRPGEEKDFYFGIDDEVSVRHDLVLDQQDETGLISHDSNVERSFVTQVQSLHSRPMDVVVSETVPVSRNAKVNLHVLAEPGTSPGFTEDADNVKGQLRWTFTLAPQEEKEIRLGWKLSWPSDYTLTGI